VFHHSCLALTTTLLVAADATAQAGDGSILVQVTDTKGAILRLARVSVSSPTQIGGIRALQTDGTGRARFPRLQPGLFKVVVDAGGYDSRSIQDAEVLVDQTRTLTVQLAPLGATVEVVAVAVPVVDATTVTAGMQFTQEELTSLPLPRNQLAALNLAPGVLLLNSGNGNPALAAGLSHSASGSNGARNNSYLLDGIDVTSPESGVYRTSVPQELVAAQDVKTGAITAEYSARAGLFSNVTTISGSNEFGGGITWVHGSPDWWARVGPGHPSVLPSRLSDATIYVSGPILKDRLWFVGSAQRVREDGVIRVDPSATPHPGETRAATTNDETRTFAKLTWAMAPEHLLVASWMRNPGWFDNLSDAKTITPWATKTLRGGTNYAFSYSWQRPNWNLDARYQHHEEADTVQTLYTDAGPQIILQTDNTAGSVPAVLRSFGNSPAGTGRLYTVRNARVDLTLFFDGMGSHVLKTGLQQSLSSLRQDVFISGGAWHENLGPLGNLAATGGPTFGYVSRNYGGYVPAASSRLLSAINNQSTYAPVRTALDLNGDGSVDLGELNSARFNELYDPAHPELGYFGYRRNLARPASSEPRQVSQGLYLQDRWQVGRCTLSPGLRLDRYEYVADNGTSLLRTAFAPAPRLGLTWDPEGEGRSKAYAYWGRYIDPVRLNVVRFTGSLTSSVQTEDVRIGGMWVTENTRGGSKNVDAVFSDAFRLPRTNEFRLGYARDLGQAWAAEATYTHRRDYDLVEDWDATLYTSPASLEAEARSVFGLGATPYADLGPAGRRAVDLFRALAVPLSTFAGAGFTGQQNVDRVKAGALNYCLANMPGAFRRYDTLDLTLTRRFADHWGGFASFTMVRATGNSNSSGDADYQGDLARFDPRLPYNNGALEGSVNWLAKAYLYARTDSGLLVGLTVNVNSGYHYSDSQNFSGSMLLRVPSDPGLISTEMLGGRMSPRSETLDLHLQYDRRLGARVRGSLTLDIFNAANHQTPTDLAAATNSPAGFSVGQAWNFLPPRRVIVGMKLRC
jgi:hypothetical protein